MYFETSVIIPKCFEKCYIMQVKNVIIKIVLQKSSLTRICSIAKTAPKTLLACKSQSCRRRAGERQRQELCQHHKGRVRPSQPPCGLWRSAATTPQPTAARSSPLCAPSSSSAGARPAVPQLRSENVKMISAGRRCGLGCCAGLA